jgi:hypothetical protein
MLTRHVDSAGVRGYWITRVPGDCWRDWLVEYDCTKLGVVWMGTNGGFWAKLRKSPDSALGPEKLEHSNLVKMKMAV